MLQGSVSFAEGVRRPGDGLRDDGQVFVCLSPILLQAARLRFRHGVCQTWKRGHAGGPGRPDDMPAGDTTTVYVYLTSPKPKGVEFCTVWHLRGVDLFSYYSSMPDRRHGLSLERYLNPYLSGKASGFRKERSNSMSWSLILRAFSGLANNNYLSVAITNPSTSSTNRSDLRVIHDVRTGNDLLQIHGCSPE